MIAKIIPILRLPANLGVFDYLIPEELSNKIKIGQLVKTNFRSQKKIFSNFFYLRQSGFVQRPRLRLEIRLEDKLLKRTGKSFHLIEC